MGLVVRRRTYNRTMLELKFKNLLTEVIDEVDL